MCAGKFTLRYRSFWSRLKRTLSGIQATQTAIEDQYRALVTNTPAHDINFHHNLVLIISSSAGFAGWARDKRGPDRPRKGAEVKPGSSSRKPPKPFG